ncbi:MAG TPA: hypothetical protein VMG36_00555 [Thermoplasmata archaeon]|nr:hypothetical protein [Thermoplasmata archaeon]
MTATATSRPLASAVPSLPWRVAGACALLLVGLLVLVYVPEAVLRMLAAHSIPSPLPVATLAAAGVAVAVLWALRYVSKPTRAYGPLTMLLAAVEIGYLLLLYADATFRLPVPNVTISIGYARLVELLLIVPALTLAAGLVTTIEDVRSPGERLPFDYPA